MQFQPFISNFFHRQTGNKKFTEPPADPSTWPKAWKTVYFKSYPRFPQVDLKPYVRPLPNVSLQNALEQRRSGREFGARPIGRGDLSNLLYYSAGIRDLSKHIKGGDWEGSFRFYPSAGARYPLEIYPLVLRGSDLEPWLYHYSVKDHALEVLWERDFVKEDPQWLEGALMYPWSREAPLILFVTAVFWRNQMKYGERGYRYILQESGHLGQKIYLVAEALGLSCCALGGFADEEVDKLLDIDGVTESTVYAFAIGVKKD
jgi:SagB-type dehydrogenase family enzyme